MRRIVIAHSRPTIGDEEIAAVEKVLRSGRLAQGAEVEAFEKECAECLGWNYAVAVSSGTAAIQLALDAVQVPPGSRIAIPTYACASLPTAVMLQGSRPVLCDAGHDLNLDPDAVPANCEGVIVAHLFGRVSRVPEHNRVIEDVAQSMGAPRKTPKGIAGITSFYATKLVTTGEGGMVLTDDSAVAEFVRDRRDYDNRDEFVLRHNYKMTDFQGTLGRVQLRRLDEFIARRREIAHRYSSAFRSLPLGIPHGDGHVYFRYVVATDDREALHRHLIEGGVEAKRPIYQPAHHYAALAADAEKRFPKADTAHDECLSLPIYPSLTDDEVEQVVQAVLHFFE